MATQAETGKRQPLKTRVKNFLFEIDGVERRMHDPFGVPLPLDDRGPKQDGKTRHIPEWLSIIPGPGLAVDIARFTEVGYHLGQGFLKGDRLRMPEAAKDIPQDKKEAWLKEYLLNRFDRSNRLAKEAYHARRARRYFTRAGVNALGLAASASFFDGGFATGANAFFGTNIVKEGLMGWRELHERRLIKKRAGKVDKDGNYDDPTFKAQVAQAVEMIGLGNTPTERADIATRLYTELNPIREEKWIAFKQLTRNNRRQIKRAARQIERLDYLIDYRTRWTNRLVRRFVEKKTIEELREKRREIRQNNIFVYDKTRGSYILAGALGGVKS